MTDERKLARISKFFIIPQRYILTILAWLSVVMCYAMRTCLSVAITRMVKIIDVRNRTAFSGEVCIFPNETDATKSMTHMIQFEWTSAQKGWIFSIFYYGYVFTHVPGGLLAGKFGGKHIVGLGTLISGILTLSTPLITEKLKYYALLVSRLMVGLAQGALFPAVNEILSNWVPVNERARLGTFAFSGTILGNIIGNAISGWSIDVTNNWATPFYLIGTMTAIWYIMWQLLVYSRPDLHPFLSDKEAEFLKNEIPEKVLIPLSQTPWMGILSNPAVLALMVAEFGHDWGYFTMVNELPSYMDLVLKFTVSKNGLLSALPYIAQWTVSLSGAFIGDIIIKKNPNRIALVRKLFTGLAGVGPGMFLVLASYSKCNRMLAIVCFCCALGTMGGYYPGMRVNGLDLTRNYAGVLMSIVNGIGVMSGMVAPTLCGYMTPNNLISEWRLVFWVSCLILTGSIVIYSLFASGQKQAFDNPNYVWPGCCKRQPREEPT